MLPHTSHSDWFVKLFLDTNHLRLHFPHGPATLIHNSSLINSNSARISSISLSNALSADTDFSELSELSELLGASIFISVFV
jgi:hypothetical protein